MAYYTPMVAAIYRLDISLHGASLGDSPYRVSVFPSHTSPAHCAAVGPGLLEATAGEAAGFLMTPRDAFGNAADVARPAAAPESYFSVSSVGCATNLAVHDTYVSFVASPSGTCHSEPSLR